MQAIIKACEEVFREIGSASECVYHKALETHLRLEGIAYQSEVTVPVTYRGHGVGSVRVDLIVGDIVVELKALISVSRLDSAVRQATAYCKLLGLESGVVINFAQDTGELQVLQV